MRKQSDGQVFRITGARQGLADDVRGRQRRYIISMSVRTLAVIAAATLWNVERHVAIVALVLGAVLPYIAVVIANAGRENAPSLPSTFVRTPLKPMIAPPRDSDPGQDRDGEGTGFAESDPEDVPDPKAGLGGEPR
ncbi:DUF3099 domain-containing protein [Streptomyces spongiae]|uniref:DUF3099 domain-containing protein n=1 Tax=Streptomyces spongiae TaxID=565072 RepID=A0A5N8XH37_9ACTN|nr:DUF3099 domain-containing protein [Streptomyces spongiae]MPY58820.1 DUF3099 domain-containing protein [Streptomyces spongiae]